MLSPENAARMLEIYQAMARAALENDWEKLAGLERGAAAIRTANPAAPDGEPPLLPDQQVALAQAIQRILELDREIRAHAEPALDSTRKLLSGTVKGRSMRDAYGRFGG